MNRRSLVFLALAGWLASASAVGAADEKVVVLEPDTDPNIPFGKLSEFAAFSDDKGPVMSLEGLSVFQPIRVTLIANDPATKFNLRIAHPGGDDVIFDQPTGDKGSVTAKFRAQGDIRIKVTSPSGRNRFNMIVWVGDTLPPRPKSVLRSIP